MTSLNNTHKQSITFVGNDGNPRPHTIHQSAGMTTKYGLFKRSQWWICRQVWFRHAQSSRRPLLLSPCTAHGHGLCSEHHDHCGNYLNWWRKASAFQECHRGCVCVGTMWVEFPDSRVDVKEFKRSEMFPSPHALLSTVLPSPHPLLDLALVPNRGTERGREERDALEVKRSMRSGLPG